MRVLIHLFAYQSHVTNKPSSMPSLHGFRASRVERTLLRATVCLAALGAAYGLVPGDRMPGKLPGMPPSATRHCAATRLCCVTSGCCLRLPSTSGLSSHPALLPSTCSLLCSNSGWAADRGRAGGAAPAAAGGGAGPNRPFLPSHVDVAQLAGSLPGAGPRGGVLPVSILRWCARLGAAWACFCSTCFCTRAAPARSAAPTKAQPGNLAGKQTLPACSPALQTSPRGQRWTSAGCGRSCCGPPAGCA